MRASTPNDRTPRGYYNNMAYDLKRSFIKMKSRYGITHDEFLTLLVLQDSKCAICKIDFVPLGQNKNLRPQVDHDHRTDEVRGLLCWNYNKSLHIVDDHKVAVDEYLLVNPASKLRTL